MQEKIDELNNIATTDGSVNWREILTCLVIDEYIDNVNDDEDDDVFVRISSSC